MRNGNVFWGVTIILLGVMFLLRASGLLAGDVLGYFWPAFLVLLGAWILVSTLIAPATGAAESFSIDLQGAREARIELDHGAGQVVIAAGAGPGQLLTGSAGTGISHSSRLVNGMLEAKIDAGPTFMPFIGPSDGVWRFGLTRDIPLSLDLDCGASSLDIDLSDLQVTHFKLDAGASSIKLQLPAHVPNTAVDIEAGAASVQVRVPAGVAARIRVEHGLGSVRIDPRFARLQDNLYQSADYDAAANRAEISFEGGAGSIDIQ